MFQWFTRGSINYILSFIKVRYGRLWTIASSHINLPSCSTDHRHNGRLISQAALFSSIAEPENINPIQQQSHKSNPPNVTRGSWHHAEPLPGFIFHWRQGHGHTSHRCLPSITLCCLEDGDSLWRLKASWTISTSAEPSVYSADMQFTSRLSASHTHGITCSLNLFISACNNSNTRPAVLSLLLFQFSFIRFNEAGPQEVSSLHVS